MKEKLIYLCFFLTVTTMLTACSSNDEGVNPLLINEWVLVSYGNESNEVIKEANGYFYYITFHTDGTYSGMVYGGNKMWGEYKCNDQGIEISPPFTTQMHYIGSDPDEFFIENLPKVYTYAVSTKELRLYYSDNQYFKFRINKNAL